MRKEFITATEVRGTETYSTIYAFNIYDESIDLQEAVKKAAAAYINTDAKPLAVRWARARYSSVLLGIAFLPSISL